MILKPIIHETKFQRNQITGLHRALCSCGWFTTGSLTECQLRASTHDTEWCDIDPRADVKREPEKVA